MTPQQIALVADSWALLAPSADEFTALFYRRLERLNPELRRLFPDNTKQSKRLASLLDTMIATLNLMDNLLPALQAMGRRYAELGVSHRDYSLAEDALLATLEEALGQRFGAAERAAWTAAFDSLSAIMEQAAASDAEEASIQPQVLLQPGHSDRIADRQEAAAQDAGGQTFAGTPAGRSDRQ